MEAWMTGAIIGGVAGGATVLAIALLSPKRKCPQCQATQPRFRKPADRKQAMWGGWTCQQCGCRMDRKGKQIED